MSRWACVGVMVCIETHALVTTLHKVDCVAKWTLEEHVFGRFQVEGATHSPVCWGSLEDLGARHVHTFQPNAILIRFLLDSYFIVLFPSEIIA